LLQVALAGASTLEPGIDVVVKRLVGGDIFVSKLDQAPVADHIDVGFGGIQRDQFGAFAGPVSRSIGSCRLPPNLVERSKAIKDRLSHDNRLLATPQIEVVSSRRVDVVVPTSPSGSRLQPDLWQQRSLVLPQLGFGGATIGGRLPNTRVG